MKETISRPHRAVGKRLFPARPSYREIRDSEADEAYQETKTSKKRRHAAAERGFGQQIQYNDEKYRHLLFDLDGTLTDPMEGITRSVQYALRHFGIEVSDLRELCPFIGPPFAESFRTFYGFDDRQTSEAVAVSREYFTEKGIFENRLYDGMDALLDTLASSGYTLCVATSKPRVFAERILDHFGIAPYFSFVGGTGLDGSLPTKADVIAHVLAGSNITDRGTALMIGDRKYDILGAKTVGIDSAGVLYGYGDRAELEAAGADYILPAIPDLKELLLG